MATTSLLILVGTAMQTSRQVRSNEHAWAMLHVSVSEDVVQQFVHLSQVEVLLERPKVQEKLQREQALIQSLRLL